MRRCSLLPTRATKRRTTSLLRLGSTNTDKFHPQSFQHWDDEPHDPEQERHIHQHVSEDEAARLFIQSAEEVERERARRTILEVQHQQDLADVDTVRRIAQSLNAQASPTTQPPGLSRRAQSLMEQAQRHPIPDTDEWKEEKRSEEDITVGQPTQHASADEDTDDDDDILVGQPTLRVPAAASSQATSQGYALDDYRDCLKIGPARKDRVWYCPIPTCRDHNKEDDEKDVKQAWIDGRVD